MIHRHFYLAILSTLLLNNGTRKLCNAWTIRTTTLSTAVRSSSSPLDGLKIGIVGAGPSGLLLAHYLGQNTSAQVSVWDWRPKPHVGHNNETRAYALGIGIRGRTALQRVHMWQAVRKKDFASERFDLHLTAQLPALRLRDEKDSKAGQEPSRLIYQTDLSQVLIEQLESKYAKTVQTYFDTRISSVDLDTMQVNALSNNNEKVKSMGRFDLIVGCDGVNSCVRQAMNDRYANIFQSTRDTIQGDLKVVRLSMPEQLDASAVSLLLPKRGAVSAFVEPTIEGTACVLFAGDAFSDLLLSSTNVTFLANEIVGRWPRLEGIQWTAAQQLAAQSTVMKASKVVCNTYHGRNVVLVGDAAHATGGVSGQGVNSALVDAQVLAECLLENKTSATLDGKSLSSSSQLSMIQTSLLDYSIRQVPEGAALHDLSFGPPMTSMLSRIRYGCKTLVDAVFKGRFGLGALPLQTLLTTSLQSFSDIRRARQRWYGDEEFPSRADWTKKLTKLQAEMLRAHDLPKVSDYHH